MTFSLPISRQRSLLNCACIPRECIVITVMIHVNGVRNA